MCRPALQLTPMLLLCFAMQGEEHSEGSIASSSEAATPRYQARVDQGMPYMNWIEPPFAESTSTFMHATLPNYAWQLQLVPCMCAISKPPFTYQLHMLEFCKPE
jgi:hypothetical protein